MSLFNLIALTLGIPKPKVGPATPGLPWVTANRDLSIGNRWQQAGPHREELKDQGQSRKADGSEGSRPRSGREGYPEAEHGEKADGD